MSFMSVLEECFGVALQSCHHMTQQAAMGANNSTEMLQPCNRITSPILQDDKAVPTQAF